ncbi:MAG: dethiobiotin synthase [Pirellulales bacterium]|nr:dethiobiotin synthase [Pirellulales bacterium]
MLPGLFITGTDTGVGKTYVGALMARSLCQAGRRVGVYKPAASGCRREAGELVSDDARALWQAAGRPGTLDRVCPQRFEAPLAPHLAARAEGREIDRALLRDGLNYWRAQSDILLVEGAGGLLAPLGDEEYIADLARDFRLPLVIVSKNALGAINHTLLTLQAAKTLRGGLPVAGVILNHPAPPNPNDPSLATNRRELEIRCEVPILGKVVWNAGKCEPEIDWFALATSLESRQNHNSK